MKPVVNFAQLDGRSEGLTYLSFFTGETTQLKRWPIGIPYGSKDVEPVLYDHPVSRMGTGSIHNQRIQGELEIELLKRFGSLLEELRAEYEDKFEEEDGTNKEYCSEEDMPARPAREFDHLYYT